MFLSAFLLSFVSAGWVFCRAQVRANGGRVECCGDSADVELSCVLGELEVEFVLDWGIRARGRVFLGAER